MTVKASKALRNAMLAGGALSQIFKNGKLVIYTGQAPTNAEDAATGTALVTISDNAQSITAEVRATGSVEITGGSGSITGLTVNGVDILDGQTVAFDTDAATTAQALVEAINRAASVPKYSASRVGAVVTITAPRGSGASHNTYVVNATGTLTTTDTDMSGGVNGANGLKFEAASAGELAKKSSQTWSGTIGANGTAGYWRLYGAVADTGALDSAEAHPRLQGTIAVSGGDINLTSTTLVSGVAQQIDDFKITMPA